MSLAPPTVPLNFIKAEQCEPRGPAVCQTYSTQHGDTQIHSLTHRHILTHTRDALVKMDRWMNRRDMRRKTK